LHISIILIYPPCFKQGGFFYFLWKKLEVQYLKNRISIQNNIRTLVFSLIELLFLFTKQKMKKMKRRIVFVVFVLVIVSFKFMNAQPKQLDIRSNSSYFGSISFYEDNNNDIIGSPYYNKSPMYGEILFKDSTNLTGLFRYNVYRQVLEYINNVDTFIVEKPMEIETFHIGGREFVYSLEINNRMGEEYIHGGYYEVLNQNEGKVKILLKRKCEIQETKFGIRYQGGYSRSGGKRFRITKHYYIKTSENGAALPIRKNSRFFKKNLPSTRIVDDYIQKNKNLFWNIDYIIDLIDHYNSYN
jgi:hypothetical protein